MVCQEIIIEKEDGSCRNAYVLAPAQCLYRGGRGLTPVRPENRSSPGSPIPRQAN